MNFSLQPGSHPFLLWQIWRHECNNVFVLGFFFVFTYHSMFMSWQDFLNYVSLYIHLYIYTYISFSKTLNGNGKWPIFV